MNAGECVRRLFFVIFAPDSQQESSPLSGRKSTQATVRICGASSGKHSAPYATQKEAIRAAVDAAHADGKAGHDAQVLVQRENHQFRMEWTYGHDPYPPAG
ncbi:DUF2188 domain-containing protein [Bradyrhizobium liaoningense]